MICAETKSLFDGARQEGPSHLVIKRGHHGRYRFALMTDFGRMTGDVVVQAGGDRDLARARAVAKIATLAQTLLRSVSNREADDRLDRSPQCYETDQADKSSFDIEPILGGHHGQI